MATKEARERAAAAYRERMAQAGFRRRTLFIHDKDAEKFSDLAEKRRRFWMRDDGGQPPT